MRISREGRPSAAGRGRANGPRISDQGYLAGRKDEAAADEDCDEGAPRVGPADAFAALPPVAESGITVLTVVTTMATLAAGAGGRVPAGQRGVVVSDGDTGRA
jgi:hypothetical protein